MEEKYKLKYITPSAIKIWKMIFLGLFFGILYCILLIIFENLIKVLIIIIVLFLLIVFLDRLTIRGSKKITNRIIKKWILSKL